MSISHKVLPNEVNRLTDSSTQSSPRLNDRRSTMTEHSLTGKRVNTVRRSEPPTERTQRFCIIL